MSRGYDIVEGLSEIYQWQQNLESAIDKLPYNSSRFFDPASRAAVVFQLTFQVESIELTEGFDRRVPSTIASHSRRGECGALKTPDHEVSNIRPTWRFHSSTLPNSLVKPKGQDPSKLTNESSRLSPGRALAQEFRHVVLGRLLSQRFRCYAATHDD
jgi:hypothetical protein